MKIIIKDDHSSGLKKGEKYDNLPEHVSEALVREGVAEEIKEDKEPAKRKTKEEKHSDTHTK